MISKAISLDEKVNALSDDTARLLWTWLIPHLDSEGRMYGDAQAIKSIVFPRRSISTTKVERILHQLEQKKLIIRYSFNGSTYLSAPNFEKHQLGIRKDRESASQIPPNTPDKLPSNSNKHPLEDKGSIKEDKGSIKGAVKLPEYIDKEIFNSYLEMRKQKRSTPTDHAKELLIKKLGEFKSNGDNPNEVLERSIMNGWTGIFPLDKRGRDARTGENTSSTILPTERTKPPADRELDNI